MRPRGPVAAIVATTVVVESFMIVTDMGPRLPLVTATCALAGASIWLLVSVGREAVRYETVSEPHRSPVERLPDLRITLLRQGLSYGRHDDQIPAPMHASLVASIDDELAVAHGIDRVADPAAARAVVGDDLMRFVDAPDEARAMHLEELAHIVTLIERIRPEAPQ
jgi:hypothetical protein